MRKGNSVIGKDILSLEDGTHLEMVRDLIVDAGGQRLVAIVVEESGLMSPARVIPIGEVTSFGKDAVVVRGPDSIVPTNEDETLRTIVDQKEKILGKQVYTVQGDDQGKIADIYFDEPTGTVMGYEVSGGLLGDVAKGTSFLATDDITSIGNDVIYVQPETATVLDQQVGGIQGAVRGAGDRLGEAGGRSSVRPEAASGRLPGRQADRFRCGVGYGLGDRPEGPPWCDPRTSRRHARRASFRRSSRQSPSARRRPPAPERRTRSDRPVIPPRTCGTGSPQRSAR